MTKFLLPIPMEAWSQVSKRNQRSKRLHTASQCSRLKPITPTGFCLSQYAGKHTGLVTGTPPTTTKSPACQTKASRFHVSQP